MNYKWDILTDIKVEIISAYYDNMFLLSTGEKRIIPDSDDWEDYLPQNATIINSIPFDEYLKERIVFLDEHSITLSFPYTWMMITIDTNRKDFQMYYDNYYRITLPEEVVDAIKTYIEKEINND